MKMDNSDELQWIKSTYSNGSGACVEIAHLGTDSVALRDSKDPHGPVLGVSSSAFAALVSQVRSGRLD